MKKRIFNTIKYGLLSVSVLYCTPSHALEFPLPPPGHDVLGQIQTVIAKKGDSLSSIGIRHDIGYYEMLEANADLPSNGHIKPGTEVTIPSHFIIPSVRKGLVINLAELRLYYFPTNKHVVYTFPIGAGREGWNTPLLATKIDRKKEDPVWVVPDSILAEAKELGTPIKKAYPPGPDNPLGKYAIYLAVPGIRIHGTNLPASVGRRVSHGCIRLLPDDIKFLYENLPIGTPVKIIHEENKAGWDGPVLYLESEVPFTEYNDSDSAKTSIAKALKNHPAIIDWQRVKEVTEEQTGMPVAIGHDHTITSIPANDLEEGIAADDSTTTVNADQNEIIDTIEPSMTPVEVIQEDEALINND